MQIVFYDKKDFLRQILRYNISVMITLDIEIFGTLHTCYIALFEKCNSRCPNQISKAFKTMTSVALKR